MKVESIAECSSWSILHYFWPAFSDNWSWKTIFGLFESGSFTQVLLYLKTAECRQPAVACVADMPISDNKKYILHHQASF